MSAADASLLPPERLKHQFELVAQEGEWGGSTFRYRGGTIRCLKGNFVSGLQMEGHPFDGQTMGHPEGWIAHIDLWLDERRIAPHYRVVAR